MADSTDLSLPVAHVSDTAYMVAAFRLLESRRSDAHFHDELAARLLGDAAQTYLSQAQPVKFGSWMMTVRTCMIDRWIEAKVQAGVDLVVNLAAGLDTRPYRLDGLPSSLQWLEVDFAPIIEHKNKVLADVKPRCQLERMVVDLSQESARQELFAYIKARGREVLVLTEGLLIYLEQSTVEALATGLHAIPSVKWWVSEFSTPAFLEWAVSQWREPKSSEPKAASATAHTSEVAAAAPEAKASVGFRFYPADLTGFFAAHGWELAEFDDFVAASQALNRPPPQFEGVSPEETLEAVAGSGYGVLKKSPIN